MATDTCMTVLTFRNTNDWDTAMSTPMVHQRGAKAEEMYFENKSAEYPNWINGPDPLAGYRTWVDHAAAQEFIDWVIANSPPGYIVSADVVDF